MAAEFLSRLPSEVRAVVGEVEGYCPRIRRLMPIGGHKRMVSSPLFPGYLFARFGMDQAGRFVASRSGVLGVVRFGDQPAEVPDLVIDELRAASFENALEWDLAARSFAPGQRLSICDGPFAGMEAEFVASLNGGQRALLLLEYLQRPINLVADASALEMVV